MSMKSSYEPGEYEAEIYSAWENAGLFNPVKPSYASSENDSDNCYSIVMPPPNANGNLHIGHGLTIAIEDSLTRYNRLRGKSTWYVPGADHAGFETWVVYERNLEKEGKSRFDFDRNVLYKNVWDFVSSQRGNMELQLRSLGASCPWKDLTFTLDENVIKRVYSTFKKMWEDGLIYRKEKLVNFCPHHRTAFADIEVTHTDEKGFLWDIAYKVEGSDEEIVVSTTRPETLFGDTAVAVNPADKRYASLVGKNVLLPLTDRKIKIIADEHAEMDFGTGAVKITPAHDFDDYEVGEHHNLEKIRVISDEGTMLPIVGEPFSGLSTLECRKLVLNELEKEGLLRGKKEITHSVARCYKCDTILEPTLKEQWFIDVKKLAKTAIAHLQNGEIKFHPESKQKVLINYLKNLKDWNISRQIPWGIAIPMFKKITPDAKNAPDWIFDERVNLQEIEIDGVKYRRDEDTFDTWFSSSHWPIVCTDWGEGKENPYYPLNVMETGADILFAWVARMIMIGLYVTGEVPFREVYLHGLVLDAHGKKMSKSKGNVINPIELVSKYGSDAFRLGILRGRSAGMNQAFSENSVISGRNLCNKLWNVSRFIDTLVSDSKDEDSKDEDSKDKDSKDKVKNDNISEDWILRELENCRKEIESDFESYRFAEAIETLYETIWNKYADWFLETEKVYKNVPLLKKTLEMILIMLHPFAPFLTETIWQNLSWTEGFIMTASWPKSETYDPISAEVFERLIEVVTEIRSLNSALLPLSSGEKYPLLFGEDSLVNDNQLLIQRLTGVPAVIPTEGTPSGIRIALANHELYLDVPGEIIAKYKDSLVAKILSVGRELDALNARMLNPHYVERAPRELVKETEDKIEEKSKLIERLKKEMELI